MRNCTGRRKPIRQGRSWRSVLIRIILFVVFVVLGSYIAIGVDIYTYGMVSDPLPADAAIVLGAAAWGNRPSPVFEERIKHAIDLYHAGRVRVLIMTGGAGPAEPVAESIVAHNYALAHSVASQDIFYETRSTDTRENLCGAREIVEQKQLGRVLVVSDPLHLRRAITLAHELGLDAYPSPTPTSRYVSLESQLAFTAGEARLYGTLLLGHLFTGNSVPCN